MLESPTAGATDTTGVLQEASPRTTVPRQGLVLTMQADSGVTLCSNGVGRAGVIAPPQKLA